VNSAYLRVTRGSVQFPLLPRARIQHWPNDPFMPDQAEFIRTILRSERERHPRSRGRHPGQSIGAVVTGARLVKSPPSRPGMTRGSGASRASPLAWDEDRNGPGGYALPPCFLQQFDHPAHQIVLQEMLEAVRLAKERVERLEQGTWW
jgi:hypothetical protein